MLQYSMISKPAPNYNVVDILNEGEVEFFFNNARF